jgi:hypothetical protein
MCHQIIKSSMETATLANHLAQSALPHQSLLLISANELFRTALRNRNTHVLYVLVKRNALNVAESKDVIISATREVLVGSVKT